jgi:hypothetical protein
MSAGDMATLGKYKSAIKGLHTAGTTVRFALEGGDIETFTISGATTEHLSHVSSGDITAFWTDNTYIYLGFHNGELRRLTVANLTNTKLAKFDCAIGAIAVTGTTLYVGLADGHLISYALA